MLGFSLSKRLIVTLLFTTFLLACSDSNDDHSNLPNPDLNETTVGSGFFEYNYQSGGFNKIMKVYYHIPPEKTFSSEILIVCHGLNRDAANYRNAFVNKSNDKGFIVIAPEFSVANFPNGDAYNLGNVYVDGDNPTANSLNPEGQWTFSIVEPLFDYVKTQLGNSNNAYKMFGHSAGAQFAHRFIIFKPNNRANETVLSAAGWYTFPDLTVDFPYGYKNSILQGSSREILWSKNITVQIGENDNNPNASGLRHNEIVDMQGLNRFERATNFYNFCEVSAQNLNLDFNWNFVLRPNADHNFVSAAQDAADILFN